MRSAKNLSKVVASFVLAVTLLVIGGIGHAASGTEFEGTLFVRGVGQVEVEPDQVILTFSARALRPTASEAMAEQARQTFKANEVILAFGIPARNIQTQHMSLREEWEWVQNERFLRGYVAEQRIQVAVDNIDDLGALIDALVLEADIESIQNIQFHRKDRQEAAIEALKAAYAHAESRALALAAAAGVELVGPVTITDETSDPASLTIMQPEMAQMALRAYSDSVGTTVQGGMLTVEARVRVEFAYRQGSGLTLLTDRSTYKSGAHVVVTLRNQGMERAGYNLCSSRLEQLVDGVWKTVASDRVCTMELRTLTPGSSDSFPFRDLGELASGTYRFRTNVQIGNGGTKWITTDPFVVE